MEQHDVDSTPAEAADFGTALREAGEQVVAAFAAAWALLRVELQLARSSALALVWLVLAFVFFGVGAWLAISVAVAVAIYELSGSLLFGIAGVAVANVVGMAVVLWAMRNCWRDLALPRTRRALGQWSEPHDDA